MLRLELFREVNHIYIKLFQDASDDAYVSHSLKISDEHLNQIRFKMQEVHDLEALIELGKDIYRIIEPIAQRLEQKKEDDLILFLDKKLVSVPWELAYAGNSFLCEKFRIGRIVTGNDGPETGQTRQVQKPYQVLILADPEGNSIRARDEGRKIQQQIQIGSNVSIELLTGPITKEQLTKQSFFQYDVVLFLGDLVYTPGDIDRTGWVLADEQIFGISTIESLASQSSQASFPKLIISNNNRRISARPEGSTVSFPPHLSVKSNYENKVFVSYAWGGESEELVDQLEQAFAGRGIRIMRDKRNLDYKGSIEEFERRIGQGQCVVLVISDKYLRSEHCMHELLEVHQNRELRDRIFPVVLADAQIYKALDRLIYIKYWDEQIEKLNHAIKQVEVMANLKGIYTDLDKYARIRASFDHLTDLLSDMNALTPAIHAVSVFSTLIDAVEQKLRLQMDLDDRPAADTMILQVRHELHEVLTKQFSEDALRDLCTFRLHYSYDDLEARGKDGKIKELLSVIGRQGHIAELIAAIQEMRPSVHFSFEWNEYEAVYSLPEAFLRAGVSYYVDMQQQSGDESAIVTSIAEFIDRILSGSSIGEVVQLYLKKTIHDPTRQEWAGCTLYGYPQDSLLKTSALELDEHQADVQKKLLIAQISEDKGDWEEAERIYQELKLLVGKDQKNLLQVIETRLNSFHTMVNDVQRAAESIKQNKDAGAFFLQQIGPYKLQKMIGTDQYQTLYTAESFNGEVAAPSVVVGIPHSQGVKTQVEEFRRLMLLAHPGLVRVLDCRQDLEIFYVVYEHLKDARSLASILRANQEHQTTVPERQCIQYLIQICQTLEYAHLFGFLHCNLNPEKILITPDDQIKLKDIGLAQIQEQRELLWAGYAAPEQIRLNVFRTSVDIWAVGVLAYQMLTGSLPFGDEEETPKQIYQKISEEKPTDPTALYPNISDDLSTIVLKALDRQKRYENYRELLRDLQRVLDGNSLVIPLEERLQLYLRAGHPLISILTEDETRTDALIQRIGERENMSVYTWTAFLGLVEKDESPKWQFAGSPDGILTWFAGNQTQAILILKDFHPYLVDGLVQDFLSSLYPIFRRNRCAVILVSLHVSIPESLSKKMVIFDMETPDFAEIHALIATEQAKDESLSQEKIPVDLEEEFAWQAHGMNALDIELALRKSKIKRGGIQLALLDDLHEYKGQIVRRGGLLELVQPDITFDDMGGMKALRDHVRKVGMALRAGDWMPLPKGWLFLGVPGCGKSLAAKAIAGEWKMPLLRFDISRIYGAFLGQAEENLEEALQTAARISPSILWIDEIEKGLAGTESPGVGGTMQRVYGILLDWLQNREVPVFVVATANFSAPTIPDRDLGLGASPMGTNTPVATLLNRSPELFRAGRFDDIFFFDLPDKQARRQILDILLKKYKSVPADVDLDKLAQAADGATPVEMEQVLISVLFQAHENNQSELRNQDFERELLTGRYFSKTRATEIDAIRQIRQMTFARPVS